MSDSTTPNAGQKIIDDLKKMRAPANNDVSPEIQEMLNAPTKNTETIDPKDTEFLQATIQLIETKKIDLYTPSSLFNHEVYNQLPEAQKALAEQDSFSLLSKIREIWKLWQSGDHDTYQIMYLVHAIRLTKERLEAAGGDLYII